MRSNHYLPTSCCHCPNCKRPIVFVVVIGGLKVTCRTCGWWGWHNNNGEQVEDNRKDEP